MPADTTHHPFPTIVGQTTSKEFVYLLANALPDHGRFRHRADMPCALNATNDLEAVRAWLKTVEESSNTFESYLKEVSRLYAWSIAYKRKPLSGLGEEDFSDYKKFLAAVPTEWCKRPAVPRVKRDGSANPNWRPFVDKLSPSSIAQSLRVIAGLYSYLHQRGYLSINPFGKPPKREPKARIERYLDPETWGHLLAYIDALPRASKREQHHYERTRWVFHLAYLTGMRRNELATGVMGNFHRDMGVWWLKVMGKGNKERQVPVSAELLAALARYRVSIGLSAVPAHAEQTPLIASIAGRSPITGKAIYNIIDQTCSAAAESVKATDPAMWARLSAATTHWLRHSAASHRVNSGQDLLTVKELLGHGSVSTTEGYLHQGELERHRRTVDFSVRPQLEKKPPP